MMKIAVIFGVVFALSAAAMAQVTVTNFELEKYKKQRLAAERDYRENYERMGFPSPEELEERRERDIEMQIAFSEQLRQSRLERERIEIDRETAVINAEMLAEERRARAEAQVENETNTYYYGGGYGYGNQYPWWRYPRRWRRGGGGLVIIPQYRATPGGVYPGGTIIVPRRR